jgi:hypothetical protein
LPARAAFDGPTPMFLVKANVMATGKGMLLDAQGTITIGKPYAKSMAAKDEAEWDKRISTWALAGAPVMCLDNIKTMVSGEALEAALTTTEVQARILGKTEGGLASVPWRTVLFATGNNPQVSSDMVRRIVPIDLVSPLERPEERDGFKHPSLLAYCRENRERLLVAILTIFRAFHIAGRPPQKMRPMGSYEAWSEAVRAPLIWLGMADPAVSQDEFRESADSDRDALADLFDRWAEVFGEGSVTMADVLAEPRMRQAIEDFAEPKPGQPVTKRSLGNLLKKAKNRIIRGYKLTSEDGGKFGTKYRLLAIGALPALPASH